MVWFCWFQVNEDYQVVVQADVKNDKDSAEEDPFEFEIR